MKRRITITVEEETRDALAVLAAADNRTLANFCRYRLGKLAEREFAALMAGPPEEAKVVPCHPAKAV